MALDPSSVNVLVIDIHADDYAERIGKQFPGMNVHAVTDLSDAPADCTTFDILVAFGIAVDDALFARSPRLKWVQSLATGVDHFLRCPSLGKDVTITSGRGIHGAAMRETTLHLMLSTARPIAAMQKDRAVHVWRRRLWSVLNDKTAMVIGVGVAGIAIGQALNALGMKVIGVSRTPRAIEGFAAVEPTTRLTEVVGQADYLINVLPGDAHNVDLIGEKVFAAMKPSAIFINVGRGETVDEEALIAALQSGTIAGAGLDVFRKEPLPANSPFWDMDNVVMTPHVGGYFVEYEDYVMPIIVDNMRCFLDGRMGEMKNVVAR